MSGVCSHSAGLALLIGAGLEPKLWLTLGFAASFAAKLADTFGSEIGKRWGSTPRLMPPCVGLSPARRERSAWKERSQVSLEAW